MRALLAMLAAAVGATSAGAQSPETERPSIVVSGQGRVSTPPDVATLAYWVRGEGATPDAASAALAEKNRAVVTGLQAFLGATAEVTGGEVIVIAARDKECADGRPGPQLSTGACAVTGYVATLQGRVRTAAIAKAATAAGLAARLGATDGRVTGYDLSNRSAARRRAVAAALADARARAEALAAGSGARLGPAITISDQGYAGGDLLVTGANVGALPPPPPAPRAPIAIDAKPAPIETDAQVTVRYALGP